MGIPLTPDEFKVEFAAICTRVAECNRTAADLANKLHDLPENVAFEKEVKQVLHWDDLYRKALAVQKYLQEYRMLPADEPVKAIRKDYEVPTSGVELGLSIANLNKNISVWKARINNPRYPDAEQKHGMYTALRNEAKRNAAAERTRHQTIANASNDN